MKNIKRDSKLSKGKNSLRKVGLADKNNVKDVINSAPMALITMLSDVSCGINSFLEVQKERERTLQIQSEANARIVESNNKLNAVLAQEKVKMDQIKADFILKMKQIDNDHEKNKMISTVIDVAINRMKAMELAIGEYNISELHHNEYAMKLLEKLHDLNMNLVHQLPAIKA